MIRWAAALTGLLLMLTGPLCAEASSLDMDAVVELLTAREYRTPEGQEQIRDLVADFSIEEKDELYRRFEVSGWWMLANLYPMLPLGSMAQGDVPTAFEIGAVTLIGIGASAMANFDYTSSPTYEIMTYGGLAIAAFGYGWALTAPWLFSNEQNRDLRRALAIPEAPH